MVFLPTYRKISSVFPKNLVPKVARLIVQGGFEDIDARTFLGFALFFSSCVAVITFFLAPLFFAETAIQLGLALFSLVACAAMFYLLLVMSADARARQIEDIWPVALQIISANIKAGMTLENAIWSAARPEFGQLKDEINRMSADAFGGIPITQTLNNMTERVNSTIMNRSIRLINEGIMLGGQMASLLDQVAADIRANQLLQKEIATTTLTYSIFIVFAAVVASPILFSVSTFYAQLNENIMDKRASSQDSSQLSALAQKQGRVNLPMAFGTGGTSSIKAAESRNFALASIAITTFFSSLILGLIRTGKATRGIKYAPVFVTTALVIYLSFTAFLQSTFGTMVH
jgi:flagellar protein FlaJ